MSKTTHAILSWGDRFALIDHYAPPDATITQAFNVTLDELATARHLREQGTFMASKNIDVEKYSGMFPATPSASAEPVAPVAATNMSGKKGTATVHARIPATDTDRPETAAKRIKSPQKRGRKGDKIAVALRAVPTTPIPIDAFVQQHGVSIAVLRQSKRFLATVDDAASLGEIKVRKDKNTKALMIWREPNKTA